METGFYMGFIDDDVVVSNMDLKFDARNFRFNIKKGATSETFCDSALKILGIRMDDMDVKFIDLTHLKYKVIDSDGTQKDPLKLNTKKIVSSPKLQTKKGRRLYIANSGSNYGFSSQQMLMSNLEDCDDDFHCEEDEMMTCALFEETFGISIPPRFQIVIHLPSLKVRHINNFWPFVSIGYEIKVNRTHVIRGVPVTLEIHGRLECEFTSGRVYRGLDFTENGLTAFDRHDMSMKELLEINYYIDKYCNGFKDFRAQLKEIKIEHIQKGIINAKNARS